MPTILTSLFTDLEAGRQYRVNVFTGSAGGSPIEVKTVALSREVGSRNQLPIGIFPGSIKWNLLVENSATESAVEGLFGANVLDTFIEVRNESSTTTPKPLVYRSFLNTEHFTASLKAFPTEVQLIGTAGFELLDAIPYVPLEEISNLASRTSRFDILRQALKPINDAYNYGFSIADPISEDSLDFTVAPLVTSTPLKTEFVHDVVYAGKSCRQVIDDILTTKGLTLKLEWDLGQMRWCLFNYDAYRTADETTFSRRFFAANGTHIGNESNMLLVEPSCFENNPIKQFTPFFGEVRLRFDNDVDLSRFFGGREQLLGTPPVKFINEGYVFEPVFQGEADNGQALVRDQLTVISKDEDYRLALSLRLSTFRSVESDQATSFTTPYRLRCEIKWIGVSQTYYLKGVNSGYTWETTPELAEFVVDFRPVANKEINFLSPVIPETGTPELSIFTIDNVAQEDVTDPITNQTITINQIDEINIDNIVLQMTDEDGESTIITGRTYVAEGTQGRALNLGTVITGDLPDAPSYLGAIVVDDGVFGSVFKYSSEWSLDGINPATPEGAQLSGVDLLRLQVTSLAQTFGSPAVRTFVTFKTDQIVRSINLVRVPTKAFITYFEFDYVTSRCTVESIPINRFQRDSLVVDEQRATLPLPPSQPAIPELPEIELPIQITDVVDLDVSIDATDGTLKDGIVTETKIANDAITETKIADNAVKSAKIDDNAVTESKIDDNAITENKILSNAVTSTKIADSAVEESKIATNAVVDTKIASNAVTEAKIATNAVTSAKIFDGAVSETKIATNAVVATKIASNAVTEEKISNSAVTTVKINDGAINSNKLGTASVSTVKIQNNAVTNLKVANNAITETKLSNNAVTSVKIADSAVEESKIATNAVVATKIASNAVTNAKIADNAITTSKVLSVDFEKISRFNENVLDPKTISLDEFFDLTDFDNRKVKNTVQVESGGGDGTLSKRVSGLNEKGEIILIGTDDGAIIIGDDEIRLRHKTTSVTDFARIVSAITGNDNFLEIFSEIDNNDDPILNVLLNDVTDGSPLNVIQFLKDRILISTIDGTVFLGNNATSIKGSLTLQDNTIISGRTINAVQSITTTLPSTVDALEIEGTCATVTTVSIQSFLRGIVGGVQGRLIEITNIGSNVLTIVNESTSVSDATRRIRTRTGGDVAYLSNRTVRLRYINSRWHEISNP